MIKHPKDLLKAYTVNKARIDIDIPEVELKAVEHEFEKVFDYKLPFKERFKAFIRGENKAGRTVGMVLDGLGLFIPRLRTARNLAEHVLIKKHKAMIKDKPWYQSKTVWSAILLVLTAVLQALGVDLAGNPEITNTVYEVAYILAGAFGLFGLRAAISDKITKK